jgi:hypothetical protein
MSSATLYFSFAHRARTTARIRRERTAAGTSFQCASAGARGVLAAFGADAREIAADFS